MALPPKTQWWCCYSYSGKWHPPLYFELPAKTKVDAVRHIAALGLRQSCDVWQVEKRDGLVLDRECGAYRFYREAEPDVSWLWILISAELMVLAYLTLT